jgi:hypothetical protein
MKIPSKLRCYYLLVAWLALASAPGLWAQNVQRWIHPGWAELDSPKYQDESQYPTALSQSDVFQFFIGDVANLGYLNGGNRPHLQARIQIFKKYGTRISVVDDGPNALEGHAWNPSNPNKRYCELQPGICTPDHRDTLAQQSAIKTLWKIQPIYDLGGSVSYIALDGAGIAATLDNGFGNGVSGGCHYSLSDSIDTLVKYMRYVHNGVSGLPGRPDIKFGLIMAMANVKYQGIPSVRGFNALNDLDFSAVLNTIVTTVKQNGETVWFMHSDSPYTYVFEYPPYTSWYDYLGRLISLRDQARGLNLRYGAIFNTEWPVSGYASNQRYTDETLDYIRRYRQRTNGEDPDDFIIYSWQGSPQPPHTPYPDATFSETTPYTFMNLVKRIADPNLWDTFWGYDHRHSRQLDADIFNWQGYLAADPGLANWVTQTFGNQQRLGAEWHWLNFGVNEGRRGSGKFGSRWYLAYYSDIAAAYGPQNYAGAIDHYFVAGRNEGRYGTDPNCPEWAWGCGYW